MKLLALFASLWWISPVLAAERWERLTEQVALPTVGAEAVADPIPLETLAFTRETGDAWTRAYFTPEGQLMALERGHLPSRSAEAYRHRYQLAGESRWTGWLPVSLRPWAAWPDPGNPARATRIETASAPAGADLRQVEELLAGAPRDGFSWTPGKRHWQYDASRWRPWAGYLWDFHDGYLWKGYRKGDKLTPSQKMGHTDPQKIRSFYLSLPEDLPTTYTEERSHALSPLDKYGIWESRHAGQAWWWPSAWEAASHNKTSDWGGYCNASAAMALLWPRPEEPFTSLGVRFDPRDVAGILQVASFRVDMLFFGWRFNGLPGDEVRDPAPSLVLDVLDQYLNGEGIPVVTDVHAGTKVDNYVILAADVSIEGGDEPGSRKGKLKLEMMHYHGDSKVDRDQAASVPWWPEGERARKEWKFKAQLNPDGSVRSSEWEKKDSHPDFLWIPTANRDYPPPHIRNPYLKMDSVRALLGI
jgi:hypothetical protein